MSEITKKMFEECTTVTPDVHTKENIQLGKLFQGIWEDIKEGSPKSVYNLTLGEELGEFKSVLLEVL